MNEGKLCSSNYECMIENVVYSHTQFWKYIIFYTQSTLKCLHLIEDIKRMNPVNKICSNDTFNKK